MKRVAIAGGGASGTLLAVHLLRLARRPLEVVLLDPAERPGRGRAYADDPLEHLLNVRAAGMSARPDDRDHFTRWLSSRRPGLRSPAEAFAPRALYGEYLAAVLEEARCDAAPSIVLRHVRDSAIDVLSDGTRVQILLECGTVIEADRLALAPGHSPSVPPILPPPGEAWRWADPLGPGVGDALDPAAPVLVAGSGLTMADLVMSLDATGHRGTVHVVSRRGLLPRSHPVAPRAPEPVPFWALPRTARGLTAAARRLARSRGSDGAAIAVEALRPVADGLWAELPEKERQLVVRHLLPFWNVLRHRMPSDVALRLAELRREGRVRVTAGRIVAVIRCEAGLVAEVRPRGSGTSFRIVAQRLFDATGSGDVLSHRVVRAVLARGLAQRHPSGLGLDMEPDGHVRPARTDVGQLLGAIGPVTRGRTWETTAIPEIREQARVLAARWVGQLG